MINQADPYEIRHLEAKDLDGYLKLLSQLTEVGQCPPSTILSTLTYLRSHPDIYHLLVLVDRSSQAVLGATTLLIEKKFIHGCSSVGHIEDVVVSKDARGAGLGKKLIEAAIQISSESGCYKTILDCDENNVAFYEKCDLKRKGVQMAKYF
jgi:glucosamine-phosphate N-acetyltransferase